jgi:hypothetical protein
LEATLSGRVGPEPFNQRGGLGKAHQLFGNDLNLILDELNLTLVASSNGRGYAR